MPEKFADDLTAHRTFGQESTHDDMRVELRRCQTAVHAWGKQNRVIFDQTKEHFCIIHRLRPSGDAFRLLGVTMDLKLNMGKEIDRIIQKVRPKIKAILATRRFYSHAGMIQQFKAHILGLFRFSSLAVFHAAPGHLHELDVLMERFVAELGISCEEAFWNYNLAPLSLRRDIAALGFLHKINLGECHPAFREIFEANAVLPAYRTTRAVRRHGMQFAERFGSTDYFNRSLFAMTRVYNILAGYVVAAKNGEDFPEIAYKGCTVCA